MNKHKNESDHFLFVRTMDSQGLVDYMKQAMTIPIKREKKDHSGATSLIFAGTMFSLLGCNYLFKYNSL